MRERWARPAPSATLDSGRNALLVGTRGGSDRCHKCWRFLVPEARAWKRKDRIWNGLGLTLPRCGNRRRFWKGRKLHCDWSPGMEPFLIPELWMVMRRSPVSLDAHLRWCGLRATLSWLTREPMTLTGPCCLNNLILQATRSRQGVPPGDPTTKSTRNHLNHSEET